ncbi:ferredoxin [bacterium]|nr:ferredoxin [bacterium]
MKIKIDKGKCIGCGTCVALAPDYFQIGADNKAELIKEEVADNEEAVKNAVANCPMKAISLEGEQDEA